MGLRDVGFEEPTPIQEKAIPLILDGQDVIGAAQTGTGKTGAFVIPLMHKLLQGERGVTQVLILTPTRELARQIDEQIFALGYHAGISSATVIGGSDFGEQVKAIRAGVDIIVATPGRLLDQMNVLNLDFSNLNYLVLDEADRMLDMGFLPDVSKIVEGLPEDRQTLLFSATMPDEIQKVVNRIMKNPQKVEIEGSKPADNVDQQVYRVQGNQRLKLIEELFDDLDWSTAIIFTATKRGTDQLEKLLKKRGINAISMHGDRSQEERNEALRKFRNKTHPVMVATDVLARGIDIDNVSLIINYDVPNTPDDYIHRIGRTGRYDKKGTAITFVTRSGESFYEDIHKAVGDQITQKTLPWEQSKKKEVEERTEKKQDTPKTQSREEHSQQKQKEESPRQKKERPKRKIETKTSRENKEREKDEEKQIAEDKGKPKEKEEPVSGPEQEPEYAFVQDNNGRDFGKSAYRSLYRYEEHDFEPEIIQKAVRRNRRARKPAKGYWGVIKSFIPKIFST
ncbi:MAG: DEAD/DEAH box helicase [Balneolaceae bacterium]|nr:DEAD/DEAH box helicase [Balneolaceae bacterium]